jgi:MarR family transcriptional regulator, lower aerobic nicotinate degradation pathway regulator
VSVTPRPPSLLAQPAYLASQLSRYGRREFEHALSERGLRLIHHGVLTALDDFGPLSQQQLADSLDHDKSHLVRHLDHLENHGLVTRVPDPTDRRRNQVAITDAGRTLLSDLRQAERRSQQGLLDGLSPDEQRTLESLLRRVLDDYDRTRVGAEQERRSRPRATGGQTPHR